MKMRSFILEMKNGQKTFGEDVAVVINSILLTIVYLIGVGLTSIAARLFKKEFLTLKIDKEAKSYWTILNLSKKPKEAYYRQF